MKKDKIKSSSSIVNGKEDKQFLNKIHRSLVRTISSGYRTLQGEWGFTTPSVCMTQTKESRAICFSVRPGFVISHNVKSINTFGYEKELYFK